MFKVITCLLCDYKTADPTEIEQINDGLIFPSSCPKCGGEFWKWESDDAVRVTLNGDYLEAEKV